MRNILFLIFLSFTNLALGQHSEDCQQLSIEFRGIVKSDNMKHLLLDVSNLIQTKNRLYYYPGFILLNEAGDTIAMEAVNYYGIGTNFQVHQLALRNDISFPFTGYLQLHGSQYQKQFCEFPFEIESAEILTLETIRNESLKIGFNMAGDQLIIDFNDNGAEKTDFHFSISNDLGEIVYTDHSVINAVSVPVSKIGKSGLFYLSAWDATQKKLLPTLAFEL